MKKIIILGASRYSVKSIEAARKAGYYIVAIDREINAEGFKIADEFFVIDITNKIEILEIAKKIRASAIVPLNDYGVLTAAFVSSALGLNSISEEVAVLSTNKEAMRNRWIEKGLPCPKVEIGKTEKEIKSAILKIGIPCILKPAHGAASKGVIVIHHEKDIDDAIRFSLSFYQDKTTLVETFINATLEHSAEVLIHNGHAYVIAISDKIKTPLPYRVDKNVLYPTTLQNQKLIDINNIISDAVRALGINIGAAHIELASTENGFFLFELGARCGGGGTPEPIVHYSTGVNMFVELIRILAGDKPGNLTPVKKLCCNYHFITPPPGKIKSIKGYNEIMVIDELLDFEFFKTLGDYIPEVKTGVDRSGFAIVGGKNRQEVLKKGHLIEKMLEIEYE